MVIGQICNEPGQLIVKFHWFKARQNSRRNRDTFSNCKFGNFLSDLCFDLGQQFFVSVANIKSEGRALGNHIDQIRLQINLAYRAHLITAIFTGDLPQIHRNLCGDISRIVSKRHWGRASVIALS